MYKTNRYISALGTIAVAVVSLTACGGGSGEVVAQVGGSSITKSTLDHWIHIESVVSYELFPKKPVPRGVVPDPPNYTVCIARLESIPAKLVERGRKPTAAQLKSQCQQKYEIVRQSMLIFLINAKWLIGEGAELGVKVTDEEVRRRLEHVKKLYFPKKAEFKKYLAITGQTVSDELFRSKLQLLEVKLLQKLDPKGLTTQQQQRASTRLTESTKKWIARTRCRPRYVVSKCREYVGATSASTIGSASPAASAGVVVSTKRVRSGQIGQILAAGPRNLTVYLFEADRGSTSACYGACARVWLPVRTVGAPVVGGMAIPGDLGTIMRSDGTKQVTYFHHPLYYYAKDKDSSDIYGQGVKSFGSRWYALRTIGVKFHER